MSERTAPFDPSKGSPIHQLGHAGFLRAIGWPTDNKNVALLNGVGGPAVTWMSITPDLARTFLLFNLPTNRRKMPTLVRRYAMEMSAGEFVTTHEGAAFDVDGWMNDFQHRAEAIILSGKPQWMQVTIGLCKEAAQKMNRAKTRNMVHTLQLLGFEFADHRSVAVARAMVAGPKAINGVTGLTESVLRDFMMAAADALVFSRKACPTSVGSAPVAALAARAFYLFDPVKVERFCLALADNVPPDDQLPEDRTARRLAKLNHELAAFGGGPHRRTLYRKGQVALTGWMEGRVLEKLYESDKDLLPLPVELQKIADRAFEYGGKGTS